MATYIIRIYRNSHVQLVGMLEAVEYGRQQPFHNVTELFAVLELAFGQGKATDISDRGDASVNPETVHRRGVPTMYRDVRVS
jgi:hypothetical protein